MDFVLISPDISPTNFQIVSPDVPPDTSVFDPKFFKKQRFNGAVRPVLLASLRARLTNVTSVTKAMAVDLMGQKGGSLGNIEM